MRLGQVPGGDLLAGQAEDEGHHLLDRLRVVGPGELGHPEPVVPGLEVLARLPVVVAPGAVELLVEEARPGVVVELLLVVLVGAVAVPRSFSAGRR